MDNVIPTTSSVPLAPSIISVPERFVLGFRGSRGVEMPLGRCYRSGKRFPSQCS